MRAVVFLFKFYQSLLAKHQFSQCHGAEHSIIWGYTWTTVYPKKYAHGFCFAVLCCGYTLTDFPISIRLTSPALWQSNDCPSAGKATLMNMDKYFMWIHYERLLNHNKAKHNKTVCIFLGICCIRYMHSDYILRLYSMCIYRKYLWHCCSRGYHPKLIAVSSRAWQY